MIISPYVVPVVRHSIVKHYNWFIYTTFGEGYEMKVEKRVQNDPQYASGNRVKDFCVASVRYAVAPIPTSIFVRILEGGSEAWGVVDDIIRFLNQIGYYVLSGYLIINARNIWPAFHKMSVSGRAFILYLLTYWPIYSYHLYGKSHQRLKLPLQIAILLIAIGVSRYKINKRKSFIIKRTT